MKKRVWTAIMAAAITTTMLTGCGGGTSSSEVTSSSESGGTQTSAVGSSEALASSSEGTSSSPEESAAADSNQADGDLLVYGIYKAGDQTWFIDEGAAAQAAVEALGGTFTYVDAKMNPEEELKAIDNAIANNASGIVICTSDQTMSQAVVDKCQEAGIPVVAADDALQDGDENKLVPWVGINAYVIGEANGEWLANYVKENNLASQSEVGLMIMTMDTVSSCVPRAEGEYDKFTELVPDFDSARIFKADYDGTTDKGNTAATAVITAHPEIKTWLVTGANEEGCIGAARALESAGLDADACVVGLGAYMAKDEWNDKGADGTCVKASAYFPAKAVGEGSIDVLMQLIQGGEPEMETAVDAVVVTPEDYKDTMGKDAE